MNKEEIFKTVVGMIKSIDPECYPDFTKITMDTSFVDELNFDSMSYLMLASSLEEAYNVHPTDQKISNLVTVGEVVNYIDRHINK